ncbi:MAG: hypothetical protein NTY90_04075 [Candidatus Micrarchaeota archaeon]|nr:hypothetical protein [Candidatus Micrarchaeota archaeon]
MAARNREAIMNSLVNLRAAVEDKDPSHYRHLIGVSGMRDDEFKEKTGVMTQEIVRDIGDLKKKLYEEGFRTGMKSFEEGARTAIGHKPLVPTVSTQAAPVVHIDYDRALAQRMESLEEKLAGKLAANNNYIASEVKRREEEVKEMEARLRAEFEAIKGVASKVKSLEGGFAKDLRKPLKAVEAKISEVDNRIDSQLISSVIGAKQIDEKIKEAEKRIAAQAKAGAGTAPETVEKLAAMEKQIASFDGKKILKQITGIRKGMRGIERSVSAVDNRIDSQLIGSVIGARQMDEKIADAEKRMKALAAAKPAAKPGTSPLKAAVVGRQLAKAKAKPAAKPAKAVKKTKAAAKAKAVKKPARAAKAKRRK